MRVRRSLAAPLAALALAAGLAGCGEDADVEDVVENPSVAPGTRESGTPESPLGDPDSTSEVEVPLPEETGS